MKIGLIGFNINTAAGSDVVEIGQLAESIGVESLWTFEHVMIPLEYQSKYPYTADGRMGVAPETTMIDPLIGLTTVAAPPKPYGLVRGSTFCPSATRYCSPSRLRVWILFLAVG